MNDWIEMKQPFSEGHFIGTVLPGQNDNAVLAGHRDTVFRGLGKLDIGDLFIVETKSGNYTYEIYDAFVVDKDDRSVIIPYKEPGLTVITCYPFQYFGPAPQRYILKVILV